MALRNSHPCVETVGAPKSSLALPMFRSKKCDGGVMEMVFVSLRIGPVFGIRETNRVVVVGAQLCGKVWPYGNPRFPYSLWPGFFFLRICPCSGVQLGLHTACEELALGKGSELP